jgi:hypothetical protein
VGLSADLRRKSFPWQRDALDSLFTAMHILCPRAKIRRQRRYNAIYNGARIVAYIEPEQHRILFGFFRNFIRDTLPPPCLRTVPFPQWNRAHGGLTGYEWPIRPTSTDVAEISFLAVKAYWWI